MMMRWVYSITMDFGMLNNGLSSSPSSDQIIENSCLHRYWSHSVSLFNSFRILCLLAYELLVYLCLLSVFCLLFSVTFFSNASNVPFVVCLYQSSNLHWIYSLKSKWNIDFIISFSFSHMVFFFVYCADDAPHQIPCTHAFAFHSF